jgi:hypothetical protein
MIIVVNDQTGAVIKDARVSVVNTATGDSRDAISGSDGTATSTTFQVFRNRAILLRLEGFNLFNHGNFLGRGVTVFGINQTPVATFGQFVGAVGTSPNAIPAFANIDPPRMFQVQAKFVF